MKNYNHIPKDNSFQINSSIDKSNSFKGFPLYKTKFENNNSSLFTHNHFGSNFRSTIQNGGILLLKKNLKSSEIVYSKNKQIFQINNNKEPMTPPKIRKIVSTMNSGTTKSLPYIDCTNNSISFQITKTNNITEGLNFHSEIKNRGIPSPLLTAKTISNSGVCFICDLYTHKDRLVRLDYCEHLICVTCFKSYYERQIELGEKEFFCPFYKCHAKVILNLSKKKYISSTYWDKIEDKSQNNKVITYSERVKESVAKYNKKHVMDIIDGDTNYISYNLVKDQFCPNCSLPTLFGLVSWKYVKCLNCLRGYCKYCFKEIDNDHFDRYGVNYCRLFSDFAARKYQGHHNKFKFVKLYFQSLGGVSISYCLLFCYWLILIHRIFPKKSFCKSNNDIASIILLRIFLIIIWLIYFIIIFIIIFFFIAFSSTFPLVIIFFDTLLAISQK